MGQSDVSTKFTLVQALRGIAALWVVLFHAAEGGHIDAIRATVPPWLFAGIFDAGHYGVAIFFALSGFVIAHSLRNADASPGFAGRFVLRRSIRLDPPYWATIALVIGQQVIEARIKGAAAPDVSVAQIAAHVFYLTDILGYPQITGVFWTLCFEIQFYLGFMLMLVGQRALVRRFGASVGNIVRAGMFILAVAGALHLYGGLPRGLALIMWHAFFVGVAAYWAGQGSRVWQVALATLIGTMVVRGSTGDVISAATAGMLFLAMRTGRLATAMSNAPLQWLGMISYSLYLIHNTVTGSAYWIVGKVMPQGVVSQVVQLVFVTGLCLAAAYCLWWLVERPAHDFARRVGQRH